MKYLLSFIFYLFGCTKTHHIRHSNYYDHDSTILEYYDKNDSEKFFNEISKYHPLFARSPSSKEGTPNYTQTIHYFIWGLFSFRNSVKMSIACGKKKFRQAYTGQSDDFALISFFTFGLYIPITLRVWCG